MVGFETRSKDVLDTLPAPSDPVDIKSDADRRYGMLEFWMHRMVQERAVYLPGTPIEWIGNHEAGAKLDQNAGKFEDEMSF